jgi:fused signal recognition particle receptor
MDTIIYVVIGLVVALVLWLLLGKKKAQPKASTESAELAAGESGKREAKRPAAAEASAGATQKSAAGGTADELPRSDAKDAAASPAAARGPLPGSTPPPPLVAASSAPEDRGIQRLRSGLALSRDESGFFGKLKSLFAGRAEISASILEDIEEVLLASDVGVPATRSIIERVQSELSRSDVKDPAAVWSALRQEAKRILSVGGTSGAARLTNRPTVILFVGVNGAGKTTTIGKLATKFKSEGKVCVLAAGDTFRAAAVQQLTIWGQRVGCEVIRGKDGADPGSVVFEAIKRAEEIGADVVLADSAGRLHTKSNLMAEMQKIARTASKALAGAPHEVLLVIDSTNGQNALAQAREFKESLELGGIVLTKLDGTAKGGVILGIADTLKVPVRYVGLGERPDDLHEFVADDFVEALLGKDA